MILLLAYVVIMMKMGGRGLKSQKNVNVFYERPQMCKNSSESQQKYFVVFVSKWCYKWKVCLIYVVCTQQKFFGNSTKIFCCIRVRSVLKIEICLIYVVCKQQLQNPNLKVISFGNKAHVIINDRNWNILLILTQIDNFQNFVINCNLDWIPWNFRFCSIVK